MSARHVDLLRSWIAEPQKFGNLLGFNLLTEVHGDWIRYMLRAGRVDVLQAHRNAYKTTSGLVALMLYFMIHPNSRVLIVRKTLDMAQKLVVEFEQLCEHPLVRAWFYSAYGVRSLKTDRWSKSALTLSVKTKITAEPSLQAAGIGNSRTGDHYDFIWCDDIITVEDRYSKAEREATKNYIYELENIIEPDGKTFISGTPWHPEDGFSILPAPLQFPIGSVQIRGIDEAWIAKKKERLPKSLYAANYELKHIKDVDPTFGDPIPGETEEDLYRFWYIDPAFGGKDCTAIWEGCTDGEYIYLTWARMYRGIVSEHYDEIESRFWAHNIARIYYEKNGAQKLVGDALEQRKLPHEGVSNVSNKFARITNTLKPAWNQLRFHPDILKKVTEPIEYEETRPPNPLTELLEYNIDAEHDDSPDALAGLVAAILSTVDVSNEDLLDVMKDLTKH